MKLPVKIKLKGSGKTQLLLFSWDQLFKLCCVRTAILDVTGLSHLVIQFKPLKWQNPSLNQQLQHINSSLTLKCTKSCFFLLIFGDMNHFAYYYVRLVIYFQLAPWHVICIEEGRCFYQSMFVFNLKL